jgi:DNA-binding LacI/PurR family transcriptional regulator
MDRGMSEPKRIGVAIDAQHVHADDQQLYRGVRQYSQEHPGFDCVLAPFAAAALKGATPKNVPYDGILAQATKELVADANRLGVPVVDVWRNSRVQVPINCVFPDFSKAGRMAGKHLVSRGFENFGYVVNYKDMTQCEMCDAAMISGDTLGYAAYVKARGFACSRVCRAARRGCERGDLATLGPPDPGLDRSATQAPGAFCAA